MQNVEVAAVQLRQLCQDITAFIDHSLARTIYRSPIIDWHHPDDYSQTAIVGLRKFLLLVESELALVDSLAKSPSAPTEFATNAPHLLAVWEEFVRAPLPISGINQNLRCVKGPCVKVDIVADGGDEWIKVNTLRENRLLHEFREQDSYVNSDYDSDSSASSSQAGPSTRPLPTNSLIKLGESLIQSAQSYRRPTGRPVPRIRLVLSRLELPFSDSRTDQTIAHLESLGITVQLGPSSNPPFPPSLPAQDTCTPTRNIILDLSVLVALCCDSTHHPLPTSPSEFESRFRPLTLVGNQLELGPHTNTSKDLRDQLQWEAQHPLVQELKDQLGRLATVGTACEPAFWVTEEVRARLPGLVDVIGGPDEQRRSRALFRGAETEEQGESFWAGSRWEGNEGVLKDIRIGILPSAASTDHSAFGRRMAYVCASMLDRIEGSMAGANDQSSGSSTPTPHWSKMYRHRLLPRANGNAVREDVAACAHDKPAPASGTSASLASPQQIKGSPRPRNSDRPPAMISPHQRLPSAHTLRTLLAGAERGWTVLTNNRGAVGKICREMGFEEGLPLDERDRRTAAVWIVNPSSLSEWRRLEVVKENARARAQEQEQAQYLATRCEMSGR